MANIVSRVIDAYVFRRTEEGLRFLILKRSETELYEHLWQGVAGKIEEGETAPEAAIRELKEETGLYPEKMWTIDRVNNYYDPKYDSVFLIPIFGIEVKSKDVKLSSEHVDYFWGSKDKVKNKLLWNQQKMGLENFYQMLTSEPKKLELSEIHL